MVCPICGLEGVITAVERLPKTGIVMKAIHSNGTEHRWALYDSIYDLGKQPRKSTRPDIIECPMELMVLVSFFLLLPKI
jgi:hypothetical protein